LVRGESGWPKLSPRALGPKPQMAKGRGLDLIGLDFNKYIFICCAENVIIRKSQNAKEKIIILWGRQAALIRQILGQYLIDSVTG